MPATTQSDIVKERLGDRPQVEKEFLQTPGLRELHTKPKGDIAVSLTNILKSRPRIVELRWVVGEGVEITWEKVPDHPY